MPPVSGKRMAGVRLAEGSADIMPARWMGKQDQEHLLIFERLLDFSDGPSRKRRYTHCLDLKEKIFLSENKIRNFSLQLLH